MTECENCLHKTVCRFYYKKTYLPALGNCSYYIKGDLLDCLTKKRKDYLNKARAHKNYYKKFEQAYDLKKYKYYTGKATGIEDVVRFLGREDD